MNKVLLLLFIVLLVSCGPQRKLQRTYVGKPVSVIETELGKAINSFEKEEGQIYVFEKIIHLKDTEISQHKITLDPIITPKVIKTERYFVTAVDGVISKIKMEEEYEREQRK